MSVKNEVDALLTPLRDSIEQLIEAIAVGEPAGVVAAQRGYDEALGVVERAYRALVDPGWIPADGWGAEMPAKLGDADERT